MPTIIERIEAQASGNSALSGVSGLVDQVSHAVELFEKLPDSPGDALSGLLQELGNVPLPQVQIAAQVGGQIAQVAQHMPTDFSSATSVVEPILAGIGSAVGGDVIPVLQKLIKVIQAVAGLSQFSLDDAAATPAPASPGSPAGGAPSGSGSGSGAGGSAGGAGSSGGGAGGSGSGSGGGAGPGGSGAGAGGGSSGSGGASGSGGPPPAPSPDVIAARARRVQALASARASLSVFPTPLSAPNAVIFLADITTRIPRDNFKFRKVPFIDDMQHLLSTVIALRGMDDAALRTHVSDSLNAFATFLQGTFTGYLNAYGARLQALATHADTAGIQARLNDLRAALGSIATALEGGSAGALGDLTAAGAALDALESRLELLHDPLRAEAAQVVLRTRHLPVDLERQMRQFTALVKPANTFRFLNQLQEPLQSALAQFPPEQIASDLREILAYPLKIFDAIEATGVQDILAVPTHAIDTLLQQMDAVLGQIASAVSGVFAQVQQALDQFDTQALLDQLHHAFDSLRLAIEAKAQELFKPVSDAIQNAMKELHDAVDGFDPSAVINGLKDFIGNLAGIFDDPDVKSALDAITNGIQQATQAIKSLSFKPVTGAVEEEIDGITSVLKAIDPATLSTEVKLAMTAAAALLPSDLKPVSDPLVDEFGKLVDEGPKPLLAYLAGKADVVKQEVEKFSPANLIGDALSAPFKSLTDKLDAFQPLSLLDPVRKALDGFKADLVKQLDPGPALKPLQQAYDALIAQVDKIDPAQIVKPIRDALHEAGEKFIQAIHFDDVINALSGIIDKINAGLDVAKEARQSLQQLADLFNALADSETQLRTWLQAVTNKIGAWSDVSDLAPAMAAISAGVAGAKSAGLSVSAASACDGVRTALEALAPETGHEDLIALRRRLRPDLIAALPASPEKTALQALSARFDPLSNLYGDGFDALENLRKALGDAHTQLAATLAHWDDRYARAGGPLAGLEFPSFAASDLKALFSQALEDEFIVPVGGLFGTLNQAGQAARAPLLEVVAFLQTFETRAAALLTGDTALGGLRDGLQGLADRIENVNLGFLTDGLGGIFNAVKGKIDILNPQHLADEVKQTISDTLGLLSVDSLLTDQAKKDINDAYKGIVDKLKQLDPKKVVEQAVEPVWNEKVKPQIERFDITALLQALLKKLDDLKGELRGDLDEVNGSYQKMLAAIPKADAGELVGDAVGAIGGALGF